MIIIFLNAHILKFHTVSFTFPHMKYYDGLLSFWFNNRIPPEQLQNTTHEVIPNLQDLISIVRKESNFLGYDYPLPLVQSINSFNATVKHLPLQQINFMKCFYLLNINASKYAMTIQGF